jgi:hypothetical protein
MPAALAPGSLRVELDPAVASAIVEALRARPAPERQGPSAWMPRPSEPPVAAAAAAPKAAWLATSALVGAFGGVAVGAAMGSSDASSVVRAAPIAVALAGVWAAGVWLGRHLGASR